MVNVNNELSPLDKERNNPILHEIIQDKIYSVSNEFVFKDSINLSIQNDHLLALTYNHSQKLFALVDYNGITSWRWKNLTLKTKREIYYDCNELQNIIDFIYSSVHNCYFALRTDNSLALFNSNFQEVNKLTSKSGTILCMIYNPINDELITSTIEGFKIYKLEKDEKDRWKGLMQMGNYSIVLKQHFSFTDDWIKKLEIDILNCHLYCCSSNDLYVLDFNWNLMRHFKQIHDLPITCVVYSPPSKLFITGSMDNNIKLWSQSGDLIETLKGHSKSVTKLILSPHNQNNFLSASLDGTIKMWSLDINQVIYEINFDNREIFWIGLTEGDYLYAATQYDLSVWSINNFMDFWAFSQDNVLKLTLDQTPNKKAQIITLGEEKTIRIFSRSKAYQITSTLPLPTNDLHTRIESIAYCRTLNSLYIFINNEIWIFYTKTYPCAKVAVWDANELQKPKLDSEEILIEANAELLRRKTNYLIIQNLMRMHRAIEIGLGNTRQNECSKCRTIGVLEASTVIFWNIEGPCTPITQNFLLIGLENGTVLFCDPLIKDKKYFTLNCSKDPVIEIKHDKISNYLITRIELANMYHIQYWNLPDLEFKHEIYCAKSMTSYARLDDVVLVGFEDGTVELLNIRPNLSKDSFNKPLNDQELEKVLRKSDKYEHRQKVEVIDVCHSLKLFLSCSFDGLIKIWSSNKKLIADIFLDNTLSSCCFLNSNGDLLISWQKHLFKITLNRIIHELKKNFNQEDLENSLNEDSDVLDEPALRDDTDQTLKIDLNNYLNPFNLKLNKEGVFVFDQIKLNKKKRKTEKMINRIDEYSESYYYMDPSNKPTQRSISHSLLSTPRENPLNNLEKVDLTLNTRFNQAQIHEYLVEILTAYKESERKNSFPKYWDTFPKFGKSPTGTPDRTPPEVTPRSEREKKEKTKTLLVSEAKKPTDTNDKEIYEIQTKSTRINKNVKQTEEEKEKELNRKLAELMPHYESSKLKDIKINTKELINLSTGAQSRSALPTKTSTKKPAQTIQVEIPVRKITKRKTTGPRRILKKVESESSESDLEIKTNNKIAKPTNRKIVNQTFIKPKTKPLIDHSKTVKSSDTVLKVEDQSILSKQNNDAQDIFNSILEKQSHISPLNEESVNSTIQDLLDLDQTEIELKDIQPSANTTQTHFNPKVKSLPEDKNLLLERTKNLFEYLYIRPVLPKRLTSASYVLNINDTKNEFKKPDIKFYDTFIEDIDLQENLSKNSDLNKNEFFLKWIENYEARRNKLRDRMNKARLNHDKILSDNMKKWSESIQRKSAISKANNITSKSTYNFSDQNSQNQSKLECKSELNVSKIRPKSVTFNKNSTVRSIVHVQPTYLVSQLEMEEIIKEANERLGDKMSAVSFKEPVDIETDSDYETLTGYGSNLVKDNSTLKRGVSSASSQRVKFSDIQAPRTDHRLSKLSSHNKSVKSSLIETIDSDYELISDKEDIETSKALVLRKRIKSSTTRSRTPSSIPSKRKYYNLFEYPEINLEFQLPDSPEKYLLPIRFPILYSKIIKSLSKIKLDEYQLRSR
ncbi:unnamed protein product, partial [Brachionus calyciflorus]